MVINREWNMPDSRTFSIKPIEKLIHKYAYGRMIDPFANSNKIAAITNDLDTQYDTDYHMDALDFLKIFDDNSVDCYVSNDRTDYNTLIPVLEKHKAAFGAFPEETTADSGYCSEKNTADRNAL